MREVLQILTALFTISYFYNQSFTSQVLEGSFRGFSQLSLKNKAPTLPSPWCQVCSKEFGRNPISCCNAPLSSLYDTQPMRFQSLIRKIWCGVKNCRQGSRGVPRVIEDQLVVSARRGLYVQLISFPVLLCSLRCLYNVTVCTSEWTASKCDSELELM